MILSKRAIASRANGAKSQGPSTEEGKRRSSQNAIRHGLLATGIVLKNECKATFQQVVDQHIRKFNPTDEVEHSTVEEMAAAHWRLRRLWSIQTNLMNHCMDAQSLQDSTSPVYLNPVAAAFAELSDTKQLDRLERYEGRLTRTYQRSLQTLMFLQSLDSPDQPDSAEEPSAEIAPEPNEPTATIPPNEIPPLSNEPETAQTFGEIAPIPNEPTSDAISVAWEVPEPTTVEPDQSLPAQNQLPPENLPPVTSAATAKSSVPSPPPAVESAYGQTSHANRPNVVFIRQA